MQAQKQKNKFDFNQKNDETKENEEELRNGPIERSSKKI